LENIKYSNLILTLDKLLSMEYLNFKSFEFLNLLMLFLVIKQLKLNC